LASDAIRALRHVVVTGHTGFLGARLAARLRAAGVRVTGASRATGIDLLINDLPLAGVDHVFHLAGATYVPAAWADPVVFHAINAHGTVRVLDQCRQVGVGMTYVSAYVYGLPDRLPIAESAPTRPNNPYAFSKLAAEEACRFYAATFGLPVGVLRPFNVYGPGQADAFLIPTIARQTVDPTVTAIEVADLRPRRDYVHVDDVVDALLLAPGLSPGQPFNVGSGASWSVEDVIRRCLAIAGATKPYAARGERRLNEVPDVVADVSALRAACGWTPRIDLDTGLRSVMESLAP
jgi:nucleoside-diphosphate-sugar epimerase